MVRITVTLLLFTALAGCGPADDIEHTTVPMAEVSAVTACSLISSDDVAAVIGVPVTNVVEQNRAVFGSCRYETENWQQSIGLIYFQGLQPKSAQQLADEVRADLEREGMPTEGLQIEPGLGAAAVYFPAPDDQSHTLVVQSGEHKIIVSAASHDAVVALANLAVTALP